MPKLACNSNMTLRKIMLTKENLQVATYDTYDYTCTMRIESRGRITLEDADVVA